MLASRATRRGHRGRPSPGAPDTLSVDHATVKDPRHGARLLLVQLQRDALREDKARHT